MRVRARGQHATAGRDLDAVRAAAGEVAHRLPAHWSSTTLLSFAYVTIVGYVVGFAV
jgi:hypothetical protein